MKEIPPELLQPGASEDEIVFWLAQRNLTIQFGTHGVMIGELDPAGAHLPLLYKASGKDMRLALLDYAHRN